MSHVLYDKFLNTILQDFCTLIHKTYFCMTIKKKYVCEICEVFNKQMHSQYFCPSMYTIILFK